MVGRESLVLDGRKRRKRFGERCRLTVATFERRECRIETSLATKVERRQPTLARREASVGTARVGSVARRAPVRSLVADRGEGLPLDRTMHRQEMLPLWRLQRVERGDALRRAGCRDAAVHRVAMELVAPTSTRALESK
jgi:hypothetical protein